MGTGGGARRREPRAGATARRRRSARARARPRPALPRAPRLRTASSANVNPDTTPHARPLHGAARPLERGTSSASPSATSSTVAPCERARPALLARRSPARARRRESSRIRAARSRRWPPGWRRRTLTQWSASSAPLMRREPISCANGIGGPASAAPRGLQCSGARAGPPTPVLRAGSLAPLLLALRGDRGGSLVAAPARAPASLRRRRCGRARSHRRQREPLAEQRGEAEQRHGGVQGDEGGGSRIESGGDTLGSCDSTGRGPSARIAAGSRQRRHRNAAGRTHAGLAHARQDPRRRPQVARHPRQGRRRRHRRHPARQVHPQGQVRIGASKAASASATSCSAGTCRTSCYDNTTLTGWHKGFPDALARIDLGTHRNVPWDDNVAVLPRRVRHAEGRQGSAVPARCPRQVLKRVLKRAEKLGVMPMCGLEFEWFNFIETPQSWADKKGVGPTPLTPGMFGYSLLRANQSREFFKALFDEMARVRRADRRPAHGDRPRRVRGGDRVLEALEAADRAMLFKTGAKEIGARFGIMPSFMAKWSQQYPGCSGHMPPVAVRRQEEPLLRRQGPRTAMSKLFESYLAGQVACAARVRADVLADDQQLQAAGRRLLGAGQADVGRRQPHRELPRDRRARRSRRGSRRAARAPTSIRISRWPRASPRACDGVEKNLKLTAKPIDGTNQGAREHRARAAHADRDHAHLPAVRASRATGSATTSSTTSPPPANGSGGSGTTP